MKTTVKQYVENLPKEILSLPRFLETRKNKPKAPVLDEWQKPENQRLFSELNGTIGFVAATADDDSLIFYDFDNVLTENGDFVNEKAAEWFNVLHSEKYFCELSNSERGLHIFAKPTVGKFTKGRRELDLGDGAKLEIFFGTTKFCLCTGKPFNCEPQAPIAKSEVADKMFQAVLDAVEEQNKQKAKPTKQPSKQNYSAANNLDFDSFRVNRMLDCTPPDALNFDEWFTVLSCSKNLNVDYATFDAWCRRDTSTNEHGKPRYNETENLSHWNSKIAPSFGINQLYNIAERFGYDAKAVYRDWCDLNREMIQGEAPSVVTQPAPLATSDELPPPIDDQQPEENFIGTRKKIPSCPVDLLLPDNYLFDRNGIRFVIPPKNGDGTPKIIPVTRTPIIPTKKFREPVKGTVEYEFAIGVDGDWNKAEVDGAALADPRELAKILSKREALILDSKLLCRFFAEVISINPELPKLKSFNQTGWNDDCDEFACPSDDGKTIVRRTGYNYEKIFKPKGDREEWKKKFIEVTEQGGSVARVVIGAAAAAFLVKPLGLPNLQAHLHGPRSIGKTALLEFAVSPYGSPKTGALTHTFAATPKARIEHACAFCDMPVICEELESISKKEADKIPQDIYNFYLGIGGQALKKDGTLREPKIFSGGRLTSGEHSLNHSFGNAGEFKRVLDIQCATLLEEEFAADLYGFCERNHGLFLKQWIQYIIEHRDLIRKYFHQALKAITSEQKSQHHENDRTQLTMLVISAIGYQFFKICIGLSDLAEDADAINAEFKADIAAIVRTLPTAAELDDTGRAIEFLQSFVAGNAKFFMREVDKPEFENEFTQAAQTCYGKIFKNGEVAFLPHAFTKILEEEGKFKSADKLRAEFSDKGYLRHLNGRNTYPTWFDGRARQLIRFIPNIISTPEKDALDELSDTAE